MQGCSSDSLECDSMDTAPLGPPMARLRLRSDSRRLVEALSQFRPESWSRQRSISHGAYQSGGGGWTVLPLRTPGGDPNRTDAGYPGRENFSDTSFVGLLPEFATLLHSLPGSVRGARVLALHPGTRVEEHRDDLIGFPYGQLRLHVPISTNSQAWMVIDGHRAVWEPGQLWYCDFSRSHFVENLGNTVRTHLVADCVISQAMLSLFDPSDLSQVPSDMIFLAEHSSGALPLSHPKDPRVSWIEIPRSLVADLLAPPDSREPRVRVRLRTKDGRVVIAHRGRELCTLEPAPTDHHEWWFSGWFGERAIVLEPGRCRFRWRRGRECFEFPLCSE